MFDDIPSVIQAILGIGAVLGLAYFFLQKRKQKRNPPEL